MEAPPSSRFALPVGNELKELQEDRRVTTIPYKTKAATAWGVGIFSDWASKRILSCIIYPGNLQFGDRYIGIGYQFSTTSVNS